MFLNDIDKQYIKSFYTYQSTDVKPYWRFSAPSNAAFSRISITPSVPISPKVPVSGATSSIGTAAWKNGDRVMHRVFGEGMVQRVYHDEVTENDKIEIAFDKQGTKTLLLTHAKLERI